MELACRCCFVPGADFDFALVRLANSPYVCYSRPDAVVIEVTPPDPNLCYAQMSLKLGLEHHFMTPPPVGKPNAMVADVATIISILRARLGRE